jgi:hypothetical protein
MIKALSMIVAVDLAARKGAGGEKNGAVLENVYTMYIDV